jgi:CRISPR-associated protein Cas2
MKIFTVIAYDISNDRRRNKIAGVLEKVGLRCNESVFECMLTESQIIQLKRDLMKHCDSKKDSILLYTLCKGCALKRDSIGFVPKQDDMIVVV